MTKFVILSQPRTGSTHVCSLLSSYSGVRALCEPINPSGHTHHMQPIPGAALLPDRMVHNDLRRALDALFLPKLPNRWQFLSRKSGELGSGFKIMAHQIQALKNEPEFWAYLIENEVKVIVVLRYNILQQYVSDVITTYTGQTACWDGDVKTAQVRIDISEVEPALRRIMREKEYLLDRSRNLDRRRLRYEDFRDDATQVELILPWLIGHKAALRSKLYKQNPDDLRRRVSNYDELAAEVGRLGLSHLLNQT